VSHTAIPLVAIVAAGGTISNTPTERISVEAVLDDIAKVDPEADPRRHATIEVHEVLRRGAETFTPNEWLSIGEAVTAQVARPAVAGVVVTHGTVTAEDTAYFLHLSTNTQKPVVVTCAQRRHATIGNDGDRNLIDAIRVATSQEARELGVVVVMEEEIHSARDVTKTNQRPSGFVSPGSGPLGSLEVDRVTLYRRPLRRHTFTSRLKLVPDVAPPRVDIVASYPGADGIAVDAFVTAGARAIVVSGLAFRGMPHPSQIDALESAVSHGIPVVLASRGGTGRIPVEHSHGFIRADDLSPRKARVLTLLALLNDVAGEGLQALFDEH
jgi:L-asparaginase